MINFFSLTLQTEKGYKYNNDCDLTGPVVFRPQSTRRHPPLKRQSMTNARNKI